MSSDKFNLNLVRSLTGITYKNKGEKEQTTSRLRMKNFLLKNVLSRYNVSIPSSI